MQDESAVAWVTVKTDGVWKASQAAEALAAIDGICCRVAVASSISAVCSEQDYVISNLRALGLLKKGPPEQWGQVGTPIDFLARTDYVGFVSLMRNAGVDVQHSDAGLKFSFAVDDLLDLVPFALRPEVEQISMSSPGIWSILLNSSP